MIERLLGHCDRWFSDDHRTTGNRFENLYEEKLSKIEERMETLEDIKKAIMADLEKSVLVQIQSSGELVCGSISWDGLR